MTQDYTGSNANKAKPAPEGEPKKEKNLEKIVVTDAIVKKKGLGRKIKDLFIEADFKSVIRYVASDVLLPAARNMIADGATQAIEGIIYGDRGSRRYSDRRSSGGPRITYATPVRRESSPLARHAPERSMVLGARRSRMTRDEDVILRSRTEAEAVLERMRDILEGYQFVTRGDLNELIGEPSSHVDEKWGWAFLEDAHVRQVREGFLLDLPPEEPLQQ